MKSCSRCGNGLRDTDMFCNRCGARASGGANLGGHSAGGGYHSHHRQKQEFMYYVYGLKKEANMKFLIAGAALFFGLILPLFSGFTARVADNENEFWLYSILYGLFPTAAFIVGGIQVKSGIGKLFLTKGMSPDTVNSVLIMSDAVALGLGYYWTVLIIAAGSQNTLLGFAVKRGLNGIFIFALLVFLAALIAAMFIAYKAYTEYDRGGGPRRYY